jgi:hypothetical protein
MYKYNDNAHETFQHLNIIYFFCSLLITVHKFQSFDELFQMSSNFNEDEKSPPTH